MENLGTYKDNVIGASYKLQILDSAQTLSKELQSTYKSMKIDFNKFNTDFDGNDVEKNPPIEIYEYQNFFLLEKKDGRTILLDGFRRLLWYTAPNTPILVRTYKESELTSSQILSLLVNLNHFKFFSESSYQERGFGLLLKTVFDIDITKFRDAFDAYLSSDSIKNSYSSRWNDASGTAKIDLIKERILDPHFVDDMNFISTLNSKGCMVNEYFGALVYQKRKKKKGAFDADQFLKLHKADKVLADLMEKFKKAGTNSSAKSQAAVNQIQQSYDNFFTLMEGGAVEKTYAEKIQECKELRDVLNKDKTWTKLTGNKDDHKVERAMWARLKEKKEMKFKCIVMPEETSISGYSSYGGRIPLAYGLNELIKFKNFRDIHLGMGAKEMVYGFKDPETGADWTIHHNSSGWNGYGKKYVKAYWSYDKKLSEKYKLSGMSTSYDIEVWVNIPKEEWKDL